VGARVLPLVRPQSSLPYPGPRYASHFALLELGGRNSVSPHYLLVIFRRLPRACVPSTEFGSDQLASMAAGRALREDLVRRYAPPSLQEEIAQELGQGQRSSCHGARGGSR
jgi:hypothetical protein